MRGSVAKQLRRESGFKPTAPRTYNKVELEREAFIKQFNGFTGTMSLVLRPVIKTIVECTQFERILYKTFKKRYTTNTNEELVLNQLPAKEEINELTEKIRNENV